MRAPDWICDDGRVLNLVQMSTAHIYNARQYLLDGHGEFGAMRRPGCSGFTNAEWVTLFNMELSRRARWGLL